MLKIIIMDLLKPLVHFQLCEGISESTVNNIAKEEVNLGMKASN